jgi:hypothetical protein
MPTLRDVVDENVREGDLYEKLDRNRVRCFACGHCCPIPEGQPGVCKVRYNRSGTLYVPWGYAGGVQCDPIEKKPFFHAYPGALAYSARGKNLRQSRARRRTLFVPLTPATVLPAPDYGCVFIQFLAKLAATRTKFSTIGRKSSFNQAISTLLEIFVFRIGRQTTSGVEINRTHAGATDTPNPAPTSRKMDNQ